jgi:hypothetical protein
MDGFIYSIRMEDGKIVWGRVRWFRIIFFLALKGSEAKQDSFHFVFPCSRQIKGPIFSLRFASTFSLLFPQ